MAILDSEILESHFPHFIVKIGFLMFDARVVRAHNPSAKINVMYRCTKSKKVLGRGRNKWGVRSVEWGME